MTHNQKLIEAFIRKMTKTGIGPVHPQKIVADGAIHRYRTTADHGKDATGWYVLHTDGVPCGTYGSFRTGDNKKVVLGKITSQAEKKKINAQFAQMRRQREQLKLESAVRKREQAKRDWKDASIVIPKNTYLKNKGAQAYGIRSEGRTLLVPFRNHEGKLSALQRIAPDGSKRYAGPKKGCFHMIGKSVRYRVAITEGYATAAAVHEALRCPVAMAGDSGNLKSVAKALRDKYPLAEIYIGADNDWFKEQEEGKNKGIESAREAAAEVNARVAIPIFDGANASSNDSDFNDLLRLKGEKAVRRAFVNAKTVVPVGGKEAFAMNVHSFLALPTKPRKLLVKPWLREGGQVLIHAWRGVGKTLLRDGLSAHLTTGTDFLCWEIPEPVSVLVVDGEMPKEDVQIRIREAIKAVGKKKKAPFRVITNDQAVTGPIDLRNPAWQELIEREGACSQVIFLDNVATLAGDSADFNDAKSWTEIQRWMKKMRDKGHSIIWFHNDGKGGTQLGTATREIVLDTVIQLTARKGTKRGSSFRLKYTKTRWFWGKDRAPFNVFIESDGQGSHAWSWKASQTDESKKESQKKVLKLHKQGKSLRAIEKETKVPRSTVGRLIKKGDSD